MATLLVALVVSPKTVGAEETASEAPTRPSVVVFMADDLGYADLGCYGATDIATPSVDGLAETGVRFTNAYVAAPVCSPSRAALLTGRHHFRAGVPGNVSAQPGTEGLPTSEITFAELVRPAGYATALIGKWHLGHRPETLPNGQGFDRFFGFRNGCIDYYTHKFLWARPKRHDLWSDTEEVDRKDEYFTELITKEATAFLDSVDDQPFLLYVPFNAPHYPMQAPAKWFEQNADLPPVRQAYAALVSAMDESVGKILKKLDEIGRREETFVVFLSDHGATREKRGGAGGGSNLPLRGFKFSLFEGGVRVPMIVSMPGLAPSGAVRNQTVSSMDLFPTIAKLAGVELPEDRTFDGRSLLPILESEESLGHERLCWKIRRDIGIRQGNWKLVSTTRGGESETSLFDLSVDVGETTDLSPAFPHVVDRLLGYHEQWAEEVGAAR